MEIILGIFETPTYKDLESKGFRNFNNFFYTPERIKVQRKFNDYSQMVDIICKFAASEYIITVHFSLDNLSYPFNIISITNQELAKIISEPEALAKTRFYQDCKEVDKEEVLYFLNEHFHSKNSTEEAQPFPKFQILNQYDESTMDS